MERAVDTEVTAVSLYPDRARVTRSGAVELTADDRRLVVEELPLVLDAASLRARGRGRAAVRIAAVDVRRSHHQETPAERVRAIEAEFETVQDELRELDDRRAGLVAESEYLHGLRSATKEYARGLAWGRATVEGQAELVRFVRERDTEVKAEMRAIERDKRGIERRLSKLEKELAEQQSSRPRTRNQALVEVEVTEPGAFTLELTYVVSRASWQPLYDVRLGDGGGERGLDVTCQALVRQSTGEAWKGAALTVSTARPALSQRAPSLDPWYVDAVRPQPVPVAAAMPGRARAKAALAAPAAAQADDDLDMLGELEDTAAGAEPLFEAEEVVATARTGEVAVGFEVPGTADIPSDGSPHKLTVARVRLTPRVDYLCVPKHTDAVYRRVKVTNDGPGPLLAGPASLFAGDEFIGTARLDYTPRGGELELLFGVEDRIKVERELTRRDVDKRLLCDKRQLRYAYRIGLHNLLADKAAVEVKDHIPVSRHEEIKVKLDKVDPDPAEQSDLNLMEWRLGLAAGAEQEVRYEFVVEHPRTTKLSGLSD